MEKSKSPDVAVDNFIEEVRGEWQRMWRERIDDHVRAEGIAGHDYGKLFVERGTVVMATRNFSILTLKEILEQHKILNADSSSLTNPRPGGWRRFGRAHAYKRLHEVPKKVEVDKQRQLKKGGRGWLHI